VEVTAVNGGEIGHHALVDPMCVDDNPDLRAMAFVIFRLEVEPVRSQNLFHLVRGELANR
jgi:hypothetical protein